MARYHLPAACLAIAREQLEQETMNMTKTQDPEALRVAQILAGQLKIRGNVAGLPGEIKKLIRKESGLMRVKLARMAAVLQAGQDAGLFAATIGATVTECRAVQTDTPPDLRGLSERSAPTPTPTPPTPTPPAPTPPAPAPTPPAPTETTRLPLALYVDCIPARGPGGQVPWSFWDVACTAQIKRVRGDLGVEYLGAVDYGKGWARLAQALRQDPPTGNVVVRSAHPGASHVLAALEEHAAIVVMGCR